MTHRAKFLYLVKQQFTTTWYFWIRANNRKVKSLKKITAIIVNWNDKDVIGECIQSLLNQDQPDIEIIVSDNGSNDGSIDFICERFPSVQIITNEEKLVFYFEGDLELILLNLPNLST